MVLGVSTIARQRLNRKAAADRTVVLIVTIMLVVLMLRRRLYNAAGPTRSTCWPYGSSSVTLAARVLAFMAVITSVLIDAESA